MYRFVLFGLVIALSCWGSIELPRALGRTAPFWPANALILFALLNSPRRNWPGWLIAAGAGNFAADLVTGDGTMLSAVLTLCNLAEACGTALLLQVFNKGRLDLTRTAQVLALVLVGGIVAPLASASVAAGILGWVRDADGLQTFTTWAAADGLGVLIFVPILSALRDMRRPNRRPQVRARGLAALGLLTLVTLGVFSVRQPIAFLIPPVLILAVFQLEALGAALGIAIVLVIAITGTLLGHGPMSAVQGDTVQRVLIAQIFLATLSFMSFPTASALAQRRRLRALAAANAARMERQNARLRQAEDLAGVGAWRLVAASRQLIWSDSLRRLFGFPPGEQPDLGQVMSLVHPEDRENGARLLERALRHGEDYEHQTRMVGPGGEVRYLMGRAACERDRHGRVVAVHGTEVDITGLKRAEARIAESEALFRMMAQASVDAISRTDLGGRLDYVSPAFATITGHEPRDALGGTLLEFIHPEDRPTVAGAYRRRLQASAAAPERIVYRLRHKDGHWVWIEGSPSLVTSEDGTPSAFVDVSRDISARKALEDDLVQAREAAEAAAAVKAEFLANMSHELRTPLTSVLGFTRLALEQPDLQEVSRGYIRKAAHAGTALLATVNDILDFSKLEAGQLQIRPEPVDVAEACRDTLDLFSEAAAAKGLSLRLATEGLPTAALVDPNRLRQLLLNLVGNAVKFSEAGEISVEAAWREDRLQVQVKDQGPGLSPEQQAQLFRRFSQVDGSNTRRHGGTGLGLAICRGLAEAMDGAIGVRSQAGQGACFHFEIAAPEVEAVVPGVQSELQSIRPGVRVLVADDHLVNRELVRAILAPLGAEVDEAADGAEAVDLASHQAFDIILMDLRMPRLDGADAVRAIRAGGGPNAGVPIIAFSAGADAPRAEGRRAAGFDGDLPKPVLPEQLIQAVIDHTQLVASLDNLQTSAA